MKNNLTQLVLATATVVVAFLVLDPWGLWMPDMLAMLFLAVLFLLFCVFAIFVLREKAGDEREEQHRAFAGRAAFLAGSGILMLGIVIQDLSHALDPWLVGALVGMIVVKTAAHVWSDERF